MKMLSLTPTLKPEVYNLLRVSTPTLLALNDKKLKSCFLEERKPLVLKKNKKKKEEVDEGIKSNKELLENLSQLRNDLNLDRCKDDDELSTVEFTDELTLTTQFEDCDCNIWESTENGVFLPSFNNMDILNKYIDEQNEKIDCNQIKETIKKCHELNKNNA